MKTYYTYILKCAGDSYYIGVTNNIERRFNEHEEGINPTCYTFSRRPLELMHVEMFNDINEAIAREKQLKKWSKAKKEALINDNLDNLVHLAKKNFKN